MSRNVLNGEGDLAIKGTPNHVALHDKYDNEKEIKDIDTKKTVNNDKYNEKE